MKSVCVLMPVYNGESYLREAINSILNQTFSDFEFVIINDGSTDNSEEIILSYHDPRIKYLKNEENKGLIYTLNKGIKLIDSTYIVRMDADDISMPHRIEKLIQFMEKNPAIGICGSSFQTFSKEGVGITVKYLNNHNEICLKQLYQIHVCHGSAIFRKSFFDEYNLFYNEEYNHAEDYDLFTRASSYTKLANIPYLGYLVRIHDNEVSNVFCEIQLKNSSLIKIREFKKLGVIFTNTEIDDYSKICQQDYWGVQTTPKGVEKLLFDILQANNKTRHIDPKYFENHILYLWFHYCYNTEQRQLFFNSSSFIKKSLAYKTRFYFKRLGMVSIRAKCF
ncbi:MAG: glycosyltransferase [Bacteroidetes bacterium]|nr:glycosyltransferase [Bacteroidota bacterium]